LQHFVSDFVHQVVGCLMLDFDSDVNSVKDFLAELDEEVDLSDPKWNFKYHVKESMKKGLTRSEAEESAETMIRTKCTNKRCACGEVAQFVEPKTKSIHCGRCWNEISATNIHSSHQ
jgi:hypothetical protein